MKKIPPIPKLENGTSLLFRIRKNIADWEKPASECRRLEVGENVEKTKHI